LEREDFRFADERQGHGAFTYALLSGLRGEAADDQGIVWISDLFGHVGKAVPRLTTSVQHPHHQMRGTDMPLFVLGENGTPPTANAAQAAVSYTPARPVKSGRKNWLWIGLGAAGGGGGGLGLMLAGGGGGGDSAPQTGNIDYDIPLP
jgi:hypothetical protein